MKNNYSLRSALAAGTLAALFVLPPSASAQLVGGFMRPGATVQGSPAPVQRSSPVQPSSPPVQRSFPVQQSFPMRSGAVIRGGLPQYRPSPVQGNPGYINTPVYGQRPGFNSLPYGFSQPPIVSQSSSGWHRGGNDNNDHNNYNNYNSGYGSAYNGYNNGYGSGPYYPTGGGNYNGGTYGVTSIPPIGPANGFFHNPIPPVGPANGYFSGQAPITGGGGPALLGGYYYGNYCNDGGGRHEYRSVFSGYSGFPQYIYSPNVIVVSNDYQPEYATPSLPFYTPVYQTTYNQNNYYVATPGRVDDLQAGGERAKAALEHAYPANSFQAAFADIAHAWTDGDIDLIRKHLRDPETRVSVFLDGKYSYSIASSDFSQITRDALDRLHTVSFDFTRLRKAKNGDVTAFGSHVYHAPDTAGADSSGTVPFDQADGMGTDGTDTDGTGTPKTLYVSYTLRRYGTEWDIVATDTANHDLAAVARKAGE